MSTLIQTRDSGAISATDRADITIYLYKDGGSRNQPIGIAKTFSFNINKPKTAIEVLSQRHPAGYARNPEDRTFSMNEVNVFQRIEHMSDFTSSDVPFIIDIVYTSSTDTYGTALAGAQTKVLKLKGVEFEGVSSSVDANGTEFTVDFTGRFRTLEMTGDINSEYQSGASTLTV